MGKERYVAYVSTYTMGDNHGIKIYDVDMVNGKFTEKDRVEITNSSYVTISKSKKCLYSITDFGVEAYRILPDGGLELINHAPINGMRGCYLSTDYEDKFLFVAGYHDGKLTVLRLNEDGSIGAITEEIYHKGLGTAAERHYRPHINCARMSHDNKYLFVADQGMDHVNVYKLDHVRGTLKLADVLRGDIDSAPRHVKISKNGKYVYIIHEIACNITVYTYEERNGAPYFDRIQTIETTEEEHKELGDCASGLRFSPDYKYLLATTIGDDSVTVYEADVDTGLLTKLFCLPVSGDYPKDAAFFPDAKHIVALNHESNTLTFFRTDMEGKHMMMCGPEMKVDSPNCIVFHKLA
ncbi:MAG: lactonase family protein [Lachnospiraceae bacterium]|nr:lactonase family protein [Lachnospiraceae bacterium]MBQ9123829.1 lactonase family protein [Lachnospiraceae bacterium]